VLVAGAQELTIDAPVLSEKLSRRHSYSKAVLAATEGPGRPASRKNGGLREHMERGQVKMSVYLEYIKAASMRVFFIFVLANIAQQALYLLGSLMLREWGEKNRSTGRNTFGYVLMYGVFSLSGTAAGGLATILLLVFSTLRSAKHLHDSVRLLVNPGFPLVVIDPFLRCCIPS
jgi:ATP-binding cassette subfamily C (CFTR/MRP) protein 1